MTKKRLLSLACALGFLGAACSEPTVATLELGEGTTFVPAVVDFLDNTGLDPSIALDPEGAPFISSFGFPAELEEGEIAVTRPVGSPLLPAVLLASENEGIFTRGAVSMAEEAPANVTVPLGPATEKSLAELAPDDVAGTAVAVDDQGGAHVAWVANDGLWYGAGGGQTAFAIEQVDVGTASSFGWPAIAIDDDGRPWIAVAMGDVVVVATKGGDRWTESLVVDCAGCGTERVAIGSTADGVLLAYADTGRQTVVTTVVGPAAASREGGVVPTDVESGVSGTGLSMAVDGDGIARLAYYTGDGEVHQATSSGGTWSSIPVAEVGKAEEPDWETTGIAIDGEGSGYVTYYDGGTDSVRLASDGGEGFEPLPAENTNGGANPTVAVTEDGASVFVAWYDTENQDLLLGTLQNAEGLALAEPSPPAVGAPVAQPTDGGGSGGKPSTDLTIVAPPGAAGAGFQETQLTGSAGEELSVTFDNQDSMQHNWALYEDDSASKQLAQAGDFPNDPPGPLQVDAAVEPLKAGDYFYRCDYHTGTMTGTLTVE